MAKAETPLTLTLFGGFLAQVAGHTVSLPSRKSQGLLSYLALHPGHVYLRDKLVSLFWGDVGREQARHSLSQTLFTLRKALPPAAARVLVVGRRHPGARTPGGAAGRPAGRRRVA